LHPEHQVLLSVGADIDAQENNGSTALIKAAHAGHVDMVSTLLDHGADVDIVTRSQRITTALHEAVFWSRIDCLTALLYGGARLDIKNMLDLTPYELASIYGNRYE
jgi:uncharacterized protein